MQRERTIPDRGQAAFGRVSDRFDIPKSMEEARWRKAELQNLSDALNSQGRTPQEREKSYGKVLRVREELRFLKAWIATAVHYQEELARGGLSMCELEPAHQHLAHVLGVVGRIMKQGVTISTEDQCILDAASDWHHSHLPIPPK